jgi:type I restriction enzyme S subunit
MSEAAGQDTAIEASSRKLGMAGEWRTARIEEVAERVAMGPFGSSIKVETFVPEGVPVISGQHLHGWRVDDSAGFNFITPEHAEKLRNANVRRGDVIFTHRGTIGQVSYIPSSSAYDRYVVSQSQFFLRPDLNKALPEYLVAYFRSPEGQHKLLANTSQVGVPSIAQPVTYLRSIEIPLPPLPEQHAIAHILGTLDDKIELNRKQNETLEAMARALFKAWFVDFEPVRAKMEGRWQRGQSLPGLPAHLYDLFPDRLVDSELGEIPEGWGLGKFGDVAVEHRRSVQPNQIAPGTAYIALEHMPKHCIALSEWGVGDGLESNKLRFKKWEILFGKLRPYFHKVGVAPIDGICSTDIVVVAPEANEWFGFVLGHISSVEFVEYTNAGSTGTKMPRTSWSDMARYKVVVPPVSVASGFTDQVQPLVERIVSGIHESRTLAQLRDTLLPKLISGALRVPDAEAFLKERGL